MSQIKIPDTWKDTLMGELKKSYMKDLLSFLMSEEKKSKIIYPAESEYLMALSLTPLQKVKVVIIGQDPYHGPGQAHGLSFSVKAGVKIPPSLKNIFKELNSDLSFDIPQSGDLSKWAQEGVLLLNSVLSVEESAAGAHQGRGWETFTDKIIEVLNAERENLVYILWGSYAIKKGNLINRDKNLVIEAVHPSPLSSYRGFFGHKPFSRANKYLSESGQEPINWQLI
jgi:uracil-DNA glycosylase